MEFDRQAGGALTPLPAPSIDTGMGLERVTAVLQGKLSNYDTDLFTPILAAIGERAGTTARRHDGAVRRLDARVADHMRAMTFLIADGVVPSNEWRGYVLRKIMRRAMRHGKRLGMRRSRSCTRSSTRSWRGVRRRLSGAAHQPRHHRPGDPQRGGTLRRRAHRRPAPPRGRARSRRRRQRASWPATSPSGSTTPTACRATSSRTWSRIASSTLDREASSAAMAGQREKARAKSSVQGAASPGDAAWSATRVAGAELAASATRSSVATTRRR